MEKKTVSSESVNAVVNTESVEFINAALAVVKEFLNYKGHTDGWCFEEVMSEAGYSIYRYRHSFDPNRTTKGIRPWARVIAAHCWLDFWKREDPNYASSKDLADSWLANSIYEMENPEFASNPKYRKWKVQITLCPLDDTDFDQETGLVACSMENEFPDTDTPESILVASEEHDLLLKYVDCLCPRRAAAMRMHLEGYTNSEIASAMDSTSPAVSSLLINSKECLFKMINAAKEKAA